MTYKEFYNKVQLLQNRIDWIVEENNQMNESYYKAKSLLMGLSEGAFRSDSFLSIASNIFGGTLKLRATLNCYTDYDNNNLVHFNAMSLIDAGIAKLQK